MLFLKIVQVFLQQSGFSFNEDGDYIKVSYEKVDFEYKKESTKFEVGGVVKTSDGKEIALNLNFCSENESLKITQTRGKITEYRPSPVDPLIINLY